MLESSSSHRAARRPRQERLSRDLPKCPACARPLGRRCRRRAVETLLGAVRVYPYRCMGCAHRFLAFRPGDRTSTRIRPRRAVDRVPVSIACDVTTKDGVIAGTLVEVSLQGASVDTHPTPAPGTEVSVVLHAKMAARPVRITKAVVRWSRLGRFGLKFETMAPEDTARLRQVVLAARGYSPEFVQPRRRRRERGTPWIALAAAIAGTLALSLRL